jgi:zinc protease
MTVETTPQPRSMPPTPGARQVFAVRRVVGVPVVAVRLWFRGGGRCEATPGLSWATGRLLAEGTRRLGWRELAEEVDDTGASLHGFGAFECHGVTVDALAGDWERALEWAAELALEPAFPEERLRWVARQGAAELASQWDQPEIRTAWAFAEQLYSPNPRSRPPQGSRQALAALSREACEAFHHAALGRGVVATVAGEIDDDAVGARLAELLAPLAVIAEVEAGEPEAPIGLPDPRRVVEAGSEGQAHLYMGHLTVPRLHPDLPALEMLGVILGSGAGLTGRIPFRLREQEGLAYTAQGATVTGAGTEPGHLMAYVGTSPETVERAEAAVREELERLLVEGVSEQEVADARTYLLGREPFRRETARQWADLLAEGEYWQLPLADPDWLREQLERVDRLAVESAARAHIRPAELKVTVGLP